MTPSRVQDGSLRLDRRHYKRLVWALAISLLVHLVCYGTYRLGKHFQIWRAVQLPAWLQKTKMLAAIPAQPNTTPQSPPLMFVDVDPAQATHEAPKTAKYYSSLNSKAANAQPADRDTGIPKITGKQTQVVKAEDIKRSPYDQLHPVFPTAPKNQTAEAAKPKSPKPPGDLVMAKPETQLRPDQGTAEQSRPRTIAQALARLHRNQLIGEKMREEGGVGRVRLQASFDVRATPFGAYDAAFIEAVQSRWYHLLDNISYDGYRTGEVRVEFHLTYDGRITDMKVLDNSVGEMLSLLCEKAVLDPAPYDQWPRDMRLMVGKDYRDITFTFFYN